MAETENQSYEIDMKEQEGGFLEEHERTRRLGLETHVSQAPESKGYVPPYDNTSNPDYCELA